MILAERPEALVIPEEAVMPMGERLLVNLVVDDKVELREVKLGKRFDGKVEVRNRMRRGGEVEEGEFIVVPHGVEHRPAALDGICEAVVVGPARPGRP